jgi:hypothetical protein
MRMSFCCFMSPLTVQKIGCIFSMTKRGVPDGIGSWVCVFCFAALVSSHDSQPVCIKSFRFESLIEIHTFLFC